MKLLLASRNKKKLGELRRILLAEGLDGIEVVGLDDVPGFPEAPETEPTFEATPWPRRGTRTTPPACRRSPTTRASPSTP